MTVKEILIKSATLIGREDVVSYLANDAEASEATVNTVNIMVRLLNLVVNELASSFVPMIATERISAVDRKISYATLSNNPREILNAYGAFGSDCLLKVTHAFAVVGEDAVDLEYSYFPPQLTLTDDVGYFERDIPSRVIAYGLCAEYAVSQGCYKDAVCWHERFCGGIAEFCPPKNKKIKGRNWA